MLRSLVPAPLRTRFVQADAPDVGRAFAMVVLAIVNLAGGSTSEGAPSSGTGSVHAMSLCLMPEEIVMECHKRMQHTMDHTVQSLAPLGTARSCACMPENSDAPLQISVRRHAWPQSKLLPVKRWQAGPRG